MFQNLLSYTNNFCFQYIALTCFFETFLGGWGWSVGNCEFNENPVVHLDLDFDLGFVNFGTELVLTIVKKKRLLVQSPCLVVWNQHMNIATKLCGNTSHGFKSIRIDFVMFLHIPVCALNKEVITSLTASAPVSNNHKINRQIPVSTIA